jgi:hypothetical protein
MKQIIPNSELQGLPCSNVAVSCALGKTVICKTSHDDGWMTLKDNNKFVREYLNVRRYKYFKRGERPLLKELVLDKAIVCVYGHLVYLEGNNYWSFFNNENDEVVAYWELK